MRESGKTESFNFIKKYRLIVWEEKQLKRNVFRNAYALCVHAIRFADGIAGLLEKCEQKQISYYRAENWLVG